jgi:nuclear pore complex protein Nup205
MFSITFLLIRKNNLKCSLKAQQQMPNYPGLPRGVVAILLYYDGRKTLVSTLKCLVQARLGHLWTVETSSQVLQCVTNYTDELLSDGILSKILGRFYLIFYILKLST